MANQKTHLHQKQNRESLKVGKKAAEGKKSAKRNSKKLSRAPGGGVGSVSEIPLTPENIMSLQRAVGNRTVTRLVQAKLKVSHPEDQYEREADQVADHVMRMPGGGESVQRQAAAEEEKRKKPEEGAVQMKRGPEAVQRQAMPAGEEERKKRPEA